MKKAWVLLVLVPLAASVWLTGQQPGKLPGAIRVRVTEVPVDIIVLDRDNRPVLDLKKDDFVIEEDGVPQDIVHFYLESYVNAPRETVPKPTPPKPESPSEPAFENPHYRTFLLVMGRGRHRYFDAIPQLTHFLRTGLQPTDRVAFMAYNRATDFTTDHGKLAEVLERYEKVSPSIESKLNLRMQGLAAVYGSRNVLSHFQKEIDEIFGSEDVGSRTVHSGGVPGTKERGADDRELMEAKEAVDRDEANAENGIEAPASAGVHAQVQTELMLDGMSFDEYMFKTAGGEMDKEGLLAAIQYMRYMEGEKHLIFLNDQGIPMARLAHGQGLDAVASDARVRIHSIQTGGVYLGDDSMFSASSSSSRFPGMRGMRNLRPFPGAAFNAFSIQSVRNLSRLTGGESFTYQDVGKSLQTVERTTEASYLLGYIPKNKNLDGNFRRIEVRVKRDGLRVQHRRGYFAEKEPRLYDRKLFLTYSRTAAAAGYEDLIHDVDFSLNAAVTRTPAPGLHASLAIRPPANLYTLRGDRYVGQLAISYFLFDHDGKLINETWDDLAMDLKPDTYNRVVKDGFPMERELPAPDNVKECLLRVVLYDVTNDRVGSAQAKLKLR